MEAFENCLKKLWGDLHALFMQQKVCNAILKYALYTIIYIINQVALLNVYRMKISGCINLFRLISIFLKG